MLYSGIRRWCLDGQANCQELSGLQLFPFVLVRFRLNFFLQNLFYGLFGNNKIEPALQELTEMFLDWQWDEYLSKDAPQEYMDELSGIQDGALSIGVADVGKMCSRLVPCILQKMFDQN